MSRIVLDPGELASTASELQTTAGEYQSIGSRVASCDCGCMPADVAAVVDATTAAIRSNLNAVSAWLAADSTDLAWRAGVPQDGGTAVSAASGGSYVGGSTGSYYTIGGYTPSEFLLGASSSITIGGYGYDPSMSGGINDPNNTITIGGWGYDPSMTAISDPNNTMTIGGTPLVITGGVYGPNPGGTPLVITSGGYDPNNTVTIGPAIGPGFDLTDWGLGGTGYGGLSIDVGGLQGPGAAMSSLVGMAARNNDWYSFTMLQNIIASQQRAVGIWTLPDGWRYKYSSVW